MPRFLTALLALALLLTAVPTRHRAAAGAEPVSARTARSARGELLTFLSADGVTRPVRTADDWQQRRREILDGVQAAMGTLPAHNPDLPLDVELVAETTSDGYTRQTIRYTAEGNERVPADLYLPRPLPPGKRPAVVALHPTGGAGKRLVGGEGSPRAQTYALDLARRGYVVIAPDYPSFGDYPCDFVEGEYVSGSMKGVVNHRRAVDLLCSLEFVDPARIGAIGHSLGGHNAMFLALFDERVQAIVTSCGWTPFPFYYGGDLTGWTSDRYMPLLKTRFGLDPARAPFDFDELIAALAPRGFFSSSPLHDANFDVAGVRQAIPQAQQVYELLGAPQQLQVRYPDCEHSFPIPVQEEAYAFLDRNLIPSGDETGDFAAELPRIAPLSPAEALSRFEVLPGFEIQQTAAEPLVTDPVAMCFDEDGRLFVVEMRDYSEQDQAMLGQVRVLEDRDGDGVFETSVVYADGLSWPTAIFCYDGGVFVGAPPHVYYLKDTTGDGTADQRKLVFTGFGRSNVQGLMNCFRWGLDNRIHGATSSSGGTVTRPDVPGFAPVELRGRDFSFDPRTLDLRPESGGAQHGMSFDDWGRKFVCSNSSHAQQVVYDDRYVARNPLLAAPPARIDIADDGGQAPVFRSSPIEPWRIVRTRLRVAGQVPGPVEFGGQPAGYFTGATGITIYQGDAFPEPFHGMAIVADVGSNIVHRKKLTPDGVAFTASRIDQNSEFLRSSDIWFRPVQFANAPDGCLHILDMYREVIEHPASLPPEIKKHLDLTSGQDRGRLYRVAPAGHVARRHEPLSALPSAELVELLAHANAWHRETASRLLFQRQDRSVVPALEQLARAGAAPLGRLHALWALRGLNALQAEVVAAALQDEHPRVREHALRLAEPFADSGTIQELTARQADDDDPRIRFQLAFSAGEFPVHWRAPLLARLLRRSDVDRWQQTAALSSVYDCASDVLLALLADDAFRSASGSGPVIEQLAGQIARKKSPAEISAVVEYVQSLTEEQPLQRRVVAALVAADPQLKSPTGGLTGILLCQLLLRARLALADPQTSLADRIDAFETLRLSTEISDAQLLLEAIQPAQPADLQSAALKSLSGFADPSIAEAILDRWSALTPALRNDAEEMLFSRKTGALAVLQRMESGRLAASDVTPARLRLLSSHPDAQVRKQAAAALESLGNSSRQEVVERYQSALLLRGNAERGRALFRKECSACHRLENHGYEIGPNLATIQNRGKESILLNVLDPNREVNPQYLNYVVLLEDGRSQSGMIQSESATSIVLVRAENKSDNFLRSEIEEMKSTGLSLMPEGLEKQIDEQGLADLMEYLMSLR